MSKIVIGSVLPLTLACPPLEGFSDKRSGKSARDKYYREIEAVWTYVKELILRSSNVLCHKIEPDMLFNFFDII